MDGLHFHPLPNRDFGVESLEHRIEVGKVDNAKCKGHTTTASGTLSRATTSKSLDDSSNDALSFANCKVDGK